MESLIRRMTKLFAEELQHVVKLNAFVVIAREFDAGLRLNVAGQAEVNNPELLPV